MRELKVQHKMWMYLFLLILTPQIASALPQFARRYNVSCTTCHAAVPRLNETGYRFRAAGYRMPNEIGKEIKPYTFENYNSVRAQIELYLKHIEDPEANNSENQQKVDFVEAAVHPVTGAWGTNIGTGAEFTFVPSGEVEVEQTQIKYVFGSEDSFGYLRGGVFHGLEGYSGSDRPVGLSDSLILSQSATHSSLDTLFTMTDPSVAGVTVGYFINDLNVNLSILNHPAFKRSADGGVSLSYFSSDNNKEMGDLAFSFAYFYDHQASGSALNGYYYRGRSLIPIDTDTYHDSFERMGLFLNYFITNQWNLLIGGGKGRDSLPAPSAQDHFDSYGYQFGVEHYSETQPLALGARFDQFRPDNTSSDNLATSVTFFGNWLPTHQLRIASEYQFLKTERGIQKSLEENTLTFQAMFLY